MRSREHQARADGELCNEVLPAGVVNIVTDDNELGSILSTRPLVRRGTLTGSTETGRKVMAGAAATIKRITLELGGNDAAIGLGDVDPKKVVLGIFAAAFTNAGQVCIALKRLYVHEDVYDTVCDELADMANSAIVDDPMGLRGSVWAADTTKAYELAIRMDAGTVWVNKHLDFGPTTPFGGEAVWSRY